MHNLAGHEGIDPHELLGRARSDARGYGAEIVTASVTAAHRADGRWLVRTETGTADPLRARALVFATGVVEELPEVPGLADLWGGDVVSCPYCHGWEVRDQPVAVVGSGPRAWQQLLLLRRFTEDLALVGNGPTGLERGQLDHLRRTGVAVHEEPVDRVVSKGGRLYGIAFANGAVLQRAAVFAATTRRQATELPATLGCEVSSAAIVADDEGRTGVSGVWAAGSCARPSLTVAGSVGHATTTAIAVNNALIMEELELAPELEPQSQSQSQSQLR